MEKVSIIGIDPVLISEQKLDSKCLPPVEAADLLSYLVLDTSYYTNMQFKAFRSLSAYNQMVSGFISSVLGHIISNKYVVLGKVRHSQRMNDPPVLLWIITEKDGTILCAHCVGCMAGLGECCSHIASVLFYLEVWTRLNGKLACTQVKCTWILPTFVKEISYAPIKNINFSSSKKLKQNLDKAVDDFITSLPKQDQCFTSTKPDKEIVSPSEDEKKAFYKTLNLCKKKPVALSLIKPYAEIIHPQKQEHPHHTRFV